MRTHIFYVRAFACVAFAFVLSACGGGGGGGSVPPTQPGLPTSNPAPAPTPGTVTQVVFAKVVIQNPPLPNAVPTTVPVTVFAFDRSFNQIIGAYANPIHLTLPTTTGLTLSNATVSSSSTVAMLNYDGKSLINPTITSDEPDIDPAFGDNLAYVVFRPSVGGTEYNVGSAPSGSSLAAAADGSLWFSGWNTVGRVTTEGQVSEFPVSTNGEGLVASGPDGDAWLISSVYEFLARLESTGPDTSIPALTSTYAGNLNLAAGPDGKLWYEGEAATGTSVYSVSTSGVITPVFAFNYPGLGYAPVNGVRWIYPMRSSISMIDTNGSFYICGYTGICSTQPLPPPFQGAGGSLSAVGVTQASSGDYYVTSVHSLSDLAPDGSTRWNSYFNGNFVSTSPVLFGNYFWVGRGEDAAGHAILTRFASDGSYIDFAGPIDFQTAPMGALILGSNGRLWYTREGYVGAISLPQGALAPQAAFTRTFHHNSNTANAARRTPSKFPADHG